MPALRIKRLDERTAEESHVTTLRRSLGPAQLTALGVGAIIGAGIFSTVGTAAAGGAGHVGAGPAIVVSFLVTAVACGFAAVCYAEFAAMVPVSGSAYTYAYATLGDAAAARRMIAAGDRELPPAERTVDTRHLAEGQLAMAEGRYRDAITAFRALEGHPRAWCRNCAAFYQARAFDALGEPDSALAEYERGIRSPESRRSRSDVTGLAPALRRAGELREQQGDRARAAEYYQQFLDLWRDADTDLQPAVRDVRGRLAQVSGEPNR